VKRLASICERCRHYHKTDLAPSVVENGLVRRFVGDRCDIDFPETPDSDWRRADPCYFEEVPPPKGCPFVAEHAVSQ